MCNYGMCRLSVHRCNGPGPGWTHLFCSSSLASSSTSSGLSWAGEGVEGERPGEIKEAVDEPAVVCSEEGVATWLAIWLTVCDTEFFTHERVELSFPATLSVATCRRTAPLDTSINMICTQTEGQVRIISIYTAYYKCYYGNIIIIIIIVVMMITWLTIMT